MGDKPRARRVTRLGPQVAWIVRRPAELERHEVVVLVAAQGPSVAVGGQARRLLLLGDALGRAHRLGPALDANRAVDVLCLTAGLSAPGVQAGSGREYRPEPVAWQEPGGGCFCTTSLLAVEYGREPEPRLDALGGRGRWPASGRRGTDFAVEVAAVADAVREVAGVAVDDVVPEPLAHPDRTSAAQIVNRSRMFPASE